MSSTIEEQFWSIIESARAKKTTETRLKAIHKQLLPLSVRTLAEFQGVQLAWSIALNRHDLRAAAETIMGDRGDEAFTGFRKWLLLQGRDAVQAALRDPDVIVDWKIVGNPRAEELGALARNVAGHELEDVACTVDLSAWPADRLSDNEWTDADRERLFPRLSANPPWKREAPARAKKASRWSHAIKDAVGEPLPYATDQRYRLHQRVMHPTYGECIVEAVNFDRMTVLFTDDKSRVLLTAKR